MNPRGLLALLAGGVVLAFAPAAHAQTPTPTTVMGTISGTVQNGTAGAAIPDLSVQLIAVPPSGPISAQQQQTDGGRFRFEAPADPTMTYLLRTEYAGVPYLDQASILISPDLPAAQRDLTVWETTTERPRLTIEATTASVEGVDREHTQFALTRTDEVHNPSDRVYVGAGDRITLRSPAPTGVVQVDPEQSFDGAAAIDGQTVTSTQPLRPGTTVVATTMLIAYDAGALEYGLRMVAPLPTAAMSVRVPARFAAGLRASASGTRVTDERIEDERWLVATRGSAARPGESLEVGIEGLSGRQAENPLTSTRGAALASAVALAAVSGGAGAVLLWRSRRRAEVAST